VCHLVETDRVREREKGTETGQVNESVNVILRYKEMMAGNAEHATSLKTGSFNGSSAALLVCNNKMAGFSNTHVWPCLMHWLSNWPGLLMVLA